MDFKTLFSMLPNLERLEFEVYAYDNGEEDVYSSLKLTRINGIPTSFAFQTVRTALMYAQKDFLTDEEKCFLIEVGMSTSEIKEILTISSEYADRPGFKKLTITRKDV